MEKNDYSKLRDYDNRLEKIITKVCRITTKLIDLFSKDLKKSDEMEHGARIKRYRDKKKYSAIKFRKTIRKLTKEISN